MILLGLKLYPRVNQQPTSLIVGHWMGGFTVSSLRFVPLP